MTVWVPGEFRAHVKRAYTGDVEIAPDMGRPGARVLFLFRPITGSINGHVTSAERSILAPIGAARGAGGPRCWIKSGRYEPT